MNLLYPLRRAVNLFPDRAASRHGDWSITWRDFYTRCRKSASFLREHGCNRIAVILHNRREYLELYYSTAMAHLWIVPLNTRWGIADFAFAINDSEADTVILDESFVHLLPQLRAQCPDLRHFLFAGDGVAPDGTVSYQAGVDAAAPLAHIVEPDPEEVSGLFYTSGTTGGPKAAMLTHANLYSNAIHGALNGITDPNGVFLHAAPMFHLADYGALHMMTFFGATHCYLRPFDIELLMQTIEQFRVTATVLVPTMITMLLNHKTFGKYDLSSLRRLSYGASPMPAPLLEEARAKLGCGFVQGYGMTEMSPLMTALTLEDHELRPEKLPTVGRPVIGCEIKIVDEHDNELPRGQIGEIIARGANRMKGYWKRPEVNAEVLRGGWMHSGDMGAMDEDGYITLYDRKKDMIKPGGENVYSPEVEAMILSHPAVMEAAVIGIPHPKWNETIRAVVVLREGKSATAEELIDFCRTRMTHFKCPTSVVFTDALPKGGTAKIQKNVLRQLYGK